MGGGLLAGPLARAVLVMARAWIVAERRQGAALILGRRALVPSHGRRANRSRWVAVRGLESISDRGVHIGAYSARPSWAGTGERDDRSRLAKSLVPCGCG
jgi:hypothetical protein